jgi:hypothetical protein
MLVWLSFLVCSTAQQCHVTLPTESPYAGIPACQRAGELGIHEWEANHVGMRVDKIRCTLGAKPPSGDNA